MSHDLEQLRRWLQGELATVQIQLELNKRAAGNKRQPEPSRLRYRLMQERTQGRVEALQSVLAKIEALRGPESDFLTCS